MDILDSFLKSEVNQTKYGFQYHKDESGFASIIFDGDINELMNTAYKALGFTVVTEENDRHDTRPVLNIQINQDGMLMLKDTGALIEADVDGEGTVPNFYIRFADGNDSATIRFNMLEPELYPDNQSVNYRFTNPSLSAINDFFYRNYPMLNMKWNELREDAVFDIELIPNYRAINRIMGRHKT